MYFSRAKTQLSRPNSIFQKQLRNDENVSSEYKEVSFHLKKDTQPKKIHVISRKTEESKIKLEIANLHDEIYRLKQTLEEKMSGFSNLELATIFYSNSNQITPDDVNQISTISRQLDNGRNMLTDLYNFDSINGLRKSNHQEKLQNDQLKTQLALTKKEIESKQKQIYFIRNSYDPGKIDQQKDKIRKMRQKIHIAVEEYRKLKREKEALKIDQSNTNDLERILIEKKEKLKQKKLQYKNLGNKQKQEIAAMKLKKEKLARNIAISEVLQVIEVKENPETNNHKNYIQETNNHKNYIQENDLLIDDDFQNAFNDEHQSEDDQIENAFNNEHQSKDDKIENVITRNGFDAIENESLIQTDSFLESTSIAYSESYFSSEKISKNQNIVNHIINSNLHQNKCETEQSYHSTTESTSISETSEKHHSNLTHKNKQLNIPEIKGNESKFKPYKLLSDTEKSEYEMKFNNNYSTTIEESLDATANDSSQKDQFDDSRLSSSSEDSLSLY